MILDQGPEVIHIAAIADLGQDLVQGDMGDILALDLIHDPGQDPEVAHHLSREDRDLPLFLTSEE